MIALVSVIYRPGTVPLFNGLIKGNISCMIFDKAEEGFFNITLIPASGHLPVSASVFPLRTCR